MNGYRITQDTEWADLFRIEDEDGELVCMTQSAEKAERVILAMVTLEESERTEFEKVMTQWRETLKSIPETPACNRLWKLLSNPKHSSEEVARTIQMLKHIKELPDYLQAAMNNPNVPIYRVIRELNTMRQRIRKRLTENCIRCSML